MTTGIISMINDTDNHDPKTAQQSYNPIEESGQTNHYSNLEKAIVKRSDNRRIHVYLSGRQDPRKPGKELEARILTHQVSPLILERNQRVILRTEEPLPDPDILDKSPLEVSSIEIDNGSLTEILNGKLITGKILEYLNHANQGIIVDWRGNQRGMRVRFSTDELIDPDMIVKTGLLVRYEIGLGDRGLYAKDIRAMPEMTEGIISRIFVNGSNTNLENATIIGDDGNQYHLRSSLLVNASRDLYKGLGNKKRELVVGSRVSFHIITNARDKPLAIYVKIDKKTQIKGVGRIVLSDRLCYELYDNEKDIKVNVCLNESPDDRFELGDLVRYSLLPGMIVASSAERFTPTSEGYILWIDEKDRYGNIRTADGEKYGFQLKNILNLEHAAIHAGMPVRFDIDHANPRQNTNHIMIQPQGTPTKGLVYGLKGTVKRVFQYGFVTEDHSDNDYFFTPNNSQDKIPLTKGDRVTYDIMLNQTRSGLKYQAVNIRLLNR